MDCTEIKVEMAEEGPLEPLVITEEGDINEGVAERRAVSSLTVILQSSRGESALKKEKEKSTGEDKNEEDIVSKMCLEEQNREKLQSSTEDDQTEDKQEGDKPEKNENANDGQNRSEEQTEEEMRINEKPEKPSDTEDDKVTQNEPHVDTERLNSSEQQPEGTESQAEDPKKVCNVFLFHFNLVP